jgi:formate dehydrogenase subunit gamma
MSKQHRYRRALRWSLLLLALALALPLIPYAVAATATQFNNPGVELWNAVRDRVQEPMTTQVGGVQSNQLINYWGDQWRLFRADWLVPIGGVILLGMLGIVTLFYLIRGPIKIEHGRSGKLVPRFSVNQRVVHWLAAGVFVLLGLTGLILLYGRYVLVPLLGPEGFGITASACKEIHNLFGPLFPVAIIAIMFSFGRGNSFKAIDFKWFLKAGGLFGHEMADSGYYNGGQKTWFWLTVLFGIAISVSGLILLFPNFGQGREIMGGAHFVHGIVAIVFITASLGHIYIGTLGMEGAAESMTQGYVDANWAAEHHNLWFAEMENAGMVGVSPNTMEEVKRHDDRDFRGYVEPSARAKPSSPKDPHNPPSSTLAGAGTAGAANPSKREESL